MKTTIDKDFFKRWKDKKVAMWCEAEEETAEEETEEKETEEKEIDFAKKLDLYNY